MTSTYAIVYALAELSGSRTGMFRADAEGWELNPIVSLYGAQPFGVMDAGTTSSLTG